MRLIADFETANTGGVDLTIVGVERYAMDIATEILCLCLLNADTREPLLSWRPGQRIDPLWPYVNDTSVVWEAHNAAFEQMIWQHIMEPVYGLPPLPYWRWSCSMAKALAKGCPAGLDPLAKALGVDEQKDMAASKLTRDLSKPITKKEWEARQPADWTGSKKAWLAAYQPMYDRSPATIDRVEAYCWQDDKTEAAVSAALGETSDYEREVWLHDQLINQRGVKLDIPYVTAALKVVEDAKVAVTERFQELTGGLNPNQRDKVMAWCAANGAELPDLTAGTIDALLGKQEDDDEDAGVVQRRGGLPAIVHEVLGLRRLLGAKAVEKLPRMLEWAGAGNRCRYLLQYHGAGPGRWAGRGWQPQNLPRAGIEGKTPDEVVAAFMTRDHNHVREALGMDPIIAAGRALRHALIPEDDRVFCSADFASIEARIVLALAGQRDKCDLLASGHDVYLDMAAAIFGRPITKEEKEERQIGKNTVLGCGFGMGAGKFHERYCAHKPTAFAENVIAAYRKEWAPLVPKLWYAIEEAAAYAVRDGVVRSTHGITFRPSTEGDWLEMWLPDGQCMWYREPRYAGENWRKEPLWTYKAWKDGQWKTVEAYGGLQTENAVQRLARGLLVKAMRRLEANGFPVVLTVHDEILAEPLIADADQKAFEQIMAEPEPWAKHLGVPIAVEGWTGRRGRK